MKLLYGLLACALVACSAFAEGETRFEVDGTRLFMSGDIHTGTPALFEKVISDHPHIKTLVELDIPGSLDDDAMIALAYRVRELGLNTHLTSDSEIYSGGVDLFLAGVERTMDAGAVIGVHSWSDGNRDAIDYPRGHSAHEANRAYIEDMLGDDAFYWFTIQAAPFDGIHIMTAAEVAQYGLLTQ